MFYEIIKHDMRDCGAACLASVAGHYGLQLPIAKIRQLYHTDKRGTVKALDKITEIFPPEAKLYGDSAYTDYQAEDYLLENKNVELRTQRKSNSKRLDTEKQSKLKLKMRKRIEVAISDIKKLFTRTIHSVTLKGFLIKITMYIFGLQLFKIISD